VISQTIDRKPVNPLNVNVVHARHDVNVACSGCSASYYTGCPTKMSSPYAIQVSVNYIIIDM